MGFVIDASVALAWCFADEETDFTRELLLSLRNAAPATVPSWWFVELANVLAVSERKGRVTPGQISQFIETIQSLDLDIDEESASRAFDCLLPLCRAHRLSCYDAMYLDLALRKRLPLATLDAALAKAARTLGIKILV